MEKHNELIVGLDVGSNSVGWAVVEMDGDRLKEIHGMGSRIIPASDDTKNFQQGKAQAKNAERRRKRSMRRNHHRYKLRRANLVKVLECINALPEGLGQTARPGQRMMTAIELYGLRAKAVTEPITLDELGRVLYHMNQRRGYKVLPQGLEAGEGDVALLLVQPAAGEGVGLHGQRDRSAAAVISASEGIGAGKNGLPVIRVTFVRAWSTSC
jgi:CRISPR/Cas system Type II protein with McrA/HNH and RuvC-like nuclease domain